MAGNLARMNSMILKDEVGMLRRVPLFAGVEPAKLKLLAFTSDRVSYSAGPDLFHQGDEGDAAYVMLSGTADMLVDSASGQIKVAELEPNSIVGEIAILCDVSRTATVKAADAAGDAAHPQGPFPAAVERVSGNDDRDHARAGRPAEPHHGGTERCPQPTALKRKCDAADGSERPPLQGPATAYPLLDYVTS